MLKKVNIGDFRTKIQIQKLVTTGTGIHAVKTWTDICDPSSSIYPYIKSSWVQKKDSQIYISDTTQTLNYATITARYNPSFNTMCRVLRDGYIYDILSANDPDQYRRWMEISVRVATSGG